MRPRFGVRPGRSDLFEHGAADPHDRPACRDCGHCCHDKRAIAHQPRLSGALAGADPVDRQRHVRPPQQRGVLRSCSTPRSTRGSTPAATIDPLTVPWLGVVAESGCRYFVRAEVSRPTGRRVGGDPAGQQQRHLSARRSSSEPDRGGRRGRPLGARLRRPRPPAGRCRFPTPSARCWKRPRRGRSARYARPMPLVSKTVEVAASRRIDHGDRRRLRVVSAVERRRSRAAGCWPATTTAGPASCVSTSWSRARRARSSSRRSTTPARTRSRPCCSRATCSRSRSRCSAWWPIGATSLLTVDLDVETKLPIPTPMVKKAIGDTLDYLADNLKKRAEQLAASP